MNIISEPRKKTVKSSFFIKVSGCRSKVLLQINPFYVIFQDHAEAAPEAAPQRCSCKGNFYIFVLL